MMEKALPSDEALRGDILDRLARQFYDCNRDRCWRPHDNQACGRV